MNIQCQSNIKCPNDTNFLYKKRFVRRAGIIPYMIDNNNIKYILLGLSKEKRSTWADLGGRSEKGETSIQTAIREYNEESRSVMPIDLNRTTDIVLAGKNKKNINMILFVKVDPTLYNININDKFKLIQPKNKYEDEMYLLRWIPYQVFLNMNPRWLSYSLKQVQKLLKQ